MGGQGGELARSARVPEFPPGVEVHLGNGRAGHRTLREGCPKPERESPPGPSRLARLLALAHHFDDMIREGVVKDQAEIARLCHVSRARVTQVMSLLFLAPDIQEEILSLFAGMLWQRGLSERHIRVVAADAAWVRQRRSWRDLLRRAERVSLKHQLRAAPS